MKIDFAEQMKIRDGKPQLSIPYFVSSREGYELHRIRCNEILKREFCYRPREGYELHQEEEEKKFLSPTLGLSSP